MAQSLTPISLSQFTNNLAVPDSARRKFQLSKKHPLRASSFKKHPLCFQFLCTHSRFAREQLVIFEIVRQGLNFTEKRVPQMKKKGFTDLGFALFP